jgi:hypothetical protein
VVPCAVAFSRSTVGGAQLPLVVSCPRQGGGVRVFDMDSGECVRTLQELPEAVVAVACSPDGTVPSLHPPAMKKEIANRNARGLGWEVAHAAVSRRPPIPLATIVARTHIYTHAASVWDSSLVQGPFSV